MTVNQSERSKIRQALVPPNPKLLDIMQSRLRVILSGQGDWHSFRSWVEILNIGGCGNKACFHHQQAVDRFMGSCSSK